MIGSLLSRKFLSGNKNETTLGDIVTYYVSKKSLNFREI